MTQFNSSALVLPSSNAGPAIRRHLRSTLSMRLHLDDLIGRGGYGRVYCAHTTDSPSPRLFAVKKVHVNKQIRNPTLRHEASVMLLLQGHPSIPEVYAWGRSQYYEYLALERLGETLYSTLDDSEGLTLRNLIALTCQMIDAVEHVHSHNIVHCDIKPGNFLFELDSASGRIKLIDFGVAAVYRDSVTLRHKPEAPIPRLVGTSAYASINMHQRCRPTRRDDIESLAYTTLRLLCGELPWSHLSRSFEIFPEKQKWCGAAIGAGCPPFDASPDYARWKRAFGMFYQECPTTQYAQSPPSSDSDPLPISDDGWVPTSTWPEPTDLPDEDLIGNEQEVVRTMLENIEEPPAMKRPWTTRDCGPELMVHH
ncbi:kinase-like domain-containing protein [Schizophyllum amplum]|uniref:non-specific serine/threonine protein kinase n=1 Tax=Schizophyllum amplum TaxID=97359 RepID=A0A550C4X6_9AGAR|nr:kinase-like domain-containing protein [Auriculariopsis ampla]